MINKIKTSAIFVKNGANLLMPFILAVLLTLNLCVNAKREHGFEYNPIPRTYQVVTKSFNTAYRLNINRDIMLSYSVQISSSLSLSGGQSGTVALQISKDNGVIDPYTTVATQTNNNTGTLTIGLNTTQVQAGSMSAFVPMGYYVKMVTTGNATITWVSGMETAL